MSETIEIDKTFLGLFTTKHAAVTLGVTPPYLLALLDKGKAPVRYSAIFHNMKNAVILPMDEPPSAKAIGYIGHAGLRALARLDIEYAELLSYKGLRVGKDINSNEPWDLNPMQAQYACLVHAIAWARSDHRATSLEGLPALRELHLEVSAQMKTLKSTSPDYRGWEFLHAQTFGGALGYFAGRLGLDWFKRPGMPSFRDDNNKRLRAVSKRLLRRLEPHKARWQKSSLYKDAITTQIAFNLAQIAALADDDNWFWESLHVMLKKHEDRAENVIYIMNDDPDTALMMSKPGIQENVDRFMVARKKGPKPSPDPSSPNPPTPASSASSTPPESNDVQS